jgi:hypothetical protein
MLAVLMTPPDFTPAAWLSPQGDILSTGYYNTIAMRRSGPGGQALSPP